MDWCRKSSRKIAVVFYIAFTTSIIFGCANIEKLFRPLLGSSNFDSHIVRNGDYFPLPIKKLFVGAILFERDYPTVAAAKKGIKLIEVRRLNRRKISENEANLSWSKDGSVLSFESIAQNVRRINLRDLRRYTAIKELIILKKRSDNFLNGIIKSDIHSYNAGLSWSMDGGKYAFMSNGGMGNYDIYVGELGEKARVIAPNPAKDGYALFSLVSQELAFVSGRSGNGDIYLMNLKNDELQRLTYSKRVDIFPEWFPSGDKIVFSSGSSNNHKIGIVTRSKGKRTWNKPYILTYWKGDSLRPTVSPNGRYIAFYSDFNEGGTNETRWDIYVMPYQSKKVYNQWELADMKVAEGVLVDLNTGPAWTPDSKKVFYVKKDATRFNPICSYDLYTGKNYILKTGTKMNRDILLSKHGILSFRAQVGAWDRVFIALTNQGYQLQKDRYRPRQIEYINRKMGKGNGL